jgi:DNA polymerase
VPIKHGTYRYAENAEVMLVTYAFDDSPVSVWDLTTGAKMPDDLEYGLCYTDDLITAHNAMFDRTILNCSRNLRVKIALERWRCTMVRAMAHSLPGARQAVHRSQGRPRQSEAEGGKELIHLFCKPRPKNAKIKRATRFTHPQEWQRFLDYAAQRH